MKIVSTHEDPSALLSRVEEFAPFLDRCRFYLYKGDNCAVVSVHITWDHAFDHWVISVVVIPMPKGAIAC